MIDQIRANAGMVIEELGPLSGINFGYTGESVEWLEGYIERMRESGEFDNEETRNRLISVFGSFLGECVARCHGGTWKYHDDEGMWCVAFKGGEMAFPFNKVAKQMDNGLGDGIGSFFRVIPTILGDMDRAQPPTPKKPWWKLW